MLARLIPNEPPRIFLHRLDVHHHPRTRAVFDLTIQEELGDGVRVPASPFSCDLLRRSQTVGPRTAEIVDSGQERKAEPCKRVSL